MPKVKVNKFEGYSSIRSGITRKVEKASKIINLIINKGSLCNLPYPKVIKVNAFVSNPFYFMGVYKRLDNLSQPDILVVYYYYRIPGNNNLNYIFIGSSEGQGLASIGMNLESFWDIGFKPNFETLQYNIAHSKFIQIGKALHLLGLNHGRMIRLLPKAGIDGQTLVSLVGVKAPKSVSFLSAQAGSLTGTFSFGFSFTHKKIGIDTSNPLDGINDIIFYGADDVIESNVVVQSGTTVFTTENGLYRIYLPDNRLEPLVGIIEIYVKKVGQDFWYFVESVDINNTTRVDYVSDLVGGNHYRVLVNSVTQNPFRVAEFSARSVPEQSIHAIQFKDRIYYANGSVSVPNNHLQYSPLLSPEGPKRANYIEGVEIIGKSSESITGLLEYLGQLIIFKETEIYILTDDILTGELRLLFSDKGCVNRRGGSGCINIDNKIYFVALDGVYTYDGVSNPKKISNDIEENLLLISKISYSYARFGHDPRNKLLYLVFPPETEFGLVTPTFIYHYDELDEKGIGAWTQYNLALEPNIREHFPLINLNTNNGKGLFQVELIDDNLVLLGHKHAIHTLGTLEDINIQAIPYIRFWSYQTSVMNFDSITTDKHFKMFKLETDLFLNTIIEKDFNRPISLNLNLINGKDYFRAGLDRFQTVNLNSIGEVNLGIFAKELSIEIMPLISNFSYMTLPFRIFGYEIDVSLRSRR